MEAVVKEENKEDIDWKEEPFSPNALTKEEDLKIECEEMKSNYLQFKY